jgi:hypothetical protein
MKDRAPHMEWEEFVQSISEVESLDTMYLIAQMTKFPQRAEMHVDHISSRLPGPGF